MNRIVMLMMTMSLTSCTTIKHENGGPVLLPNYKLIGCGSPSCSQIWLDQAANTSALYPKQMIIDIDNRSVQGVIATYDKSVSSDDVKMSIDQRYGKWALGSNGTQPVKLWRVEPEKFAIQLAVHEDGVKQVVYLPIR